MKSSTFKIFLFSLLVTSITFSQSKVKEKDIIGKWKFHLTLEKEIEKETKDSDGFEKIFVTGILKTIDKLVEKVDIKFHFKKDHTLRVTQKSLTGESTETIEDYEWKINEDGKLITNNIKNESLKFNDSNGWMLRKGKLVSVDDNNKVEENVWMEKVK